jgi:hypothetical protein
MVRPLKDIVAELEAKHKGFELLYDLEKRSCMITKFDLDMAYLFERLAMYEKDVKFVLDHKLSINIISRATLNLAIIMNEMCEELADYSYVIEYYLLDDYYEKNRDWWSAFVDVRTKLLTLFDSLQKYDVFEAETPDELDVFRKMFTEREIDDDEEITADTRTIIFLEEEVEKFNGAEFLVCLKFFLKAFEENLSELKLFPYDRSEDKMISIYERNYLLYAKKYWPSLEQGFQSRCTNQLPRKDVTINGLEKLRWETLHAFEYNTDAGKIWRDYSDNIPQMATQMQEQKLTEEQWKYFFRTLFEIDELDRWIEELQNPPESEEDRQKRARLLRSNKIFNLQPGNQKKGIDILLLYQFIDTRFISELKANYEWYALYYVFKKNGILKVRLAEDFAKQMNHEEWFPNVDMKCIVKAIKDYEFLEEAEPGHWVVNIRKTTGAKTSKKSFDTILQRYEYLTDCLDEIFAEETSMVKEGYTIINYGTYNDVHDNKTVKL